MKYTKSVKFWLILTAFGLLTFMFFFRKSDPPVVPSPLENQDTTPISAEIITAGKWDTQALQSFSGVIETDHQTTIQAEIGGNIGKINVNLGDRVRRGAVLASYHLGGDETFLQYKNSQYQLELTKANTEANEANAQLNISNAENDWKQAQITQRQQENEARQSLKNSAESATTIIQNALNFFDERLGATEVYRFIAVPGRSEVGLSNAILKNRTNEAVRNFSRDFKARSLFIDPVEFADQQIMSIKRLRQIGSDYLILVQDTILTPTFTLDGRQAVQSATEGINSQLDQTMVQLKTQKERFFTTKSQVRSTLSAQADQLKSAKSALEVTQTQNQNQIQSAENSLRLATARQENLYIRAPFSGVITSKTVTEGSLVSPGQSLFVITDTSGPKKIILFLNAAEIRALKSAKNIRAKSGGIIIPISEIIWANAFDTVTQKMRVELVLAHSDEVIVGLLADVAFDGKSAETIILPISAVGAEPGGYEVLVVNTENKTERRSVTIGSLALGGIEILDGITPGERVIKHKNRIFSGTAVQEDK